VQRSTVDAAQFAAAQAVRNAGVANPQELRGFITRLIRNQVYDGIQSEMKDRTKAQV
jgi:hypothetical protein